MRWPRSSGPSQIVAEPRRGVRVGVDVGSKAEILDILRAELQVGMQLLGVRSVDELGPQHVRLDYRAPRD